MAVKIENMTRGTVLLRFNSGQTLRLAPKETSEHWYQFADLSRGIVKQEKNKAIRFLPPVASKEVGSTKPNKPIEKVTAGKKKPSGKKKGKR